MCLDQASDDWKRRRTLADPYKPGAFEKRLQFRGGTRAAASHRPQVEAEIGSDRPGSAGSGHGLDHQKPAARGQGRPDCLKESKDDAVVVIMENPHQRDEIGTVREGILAKIAADRFESLAKARPYPRLGPLHHGRKIE